MWKILLVFGASLLSSCTDFSYNRAWNKALAQPHSGPAGCWEGQWISEGSGHTGRLRCIVSAEDSAKEEYKFYYHAVWAKIFHGTFALTCQAHLQKDGTWNVSGEKDLGKVFGGIFHHDAVITSTTLRAKYAASLDHGRMELTRAAALSESATR